MFYLPRAAILKTCRTKREREGSQRNTWYKGNSIPGPPAFLSTLQNELEWTDQISHKLTQRKDFSDFLLNTVLFLKRNFQKFIFILYKTDWNPRDLAPRPHPRSNFAQWLRLAKNVGAKASLENVVPFISHRWSLCRWI